MARILVVIVTYNALKWVKKCLNSVEKSTIPADVLVIDNGSTDGTLSLIRTDYPRTRIIETGENIGFGAANNRGLRIAHDECYDFALKGYHNDSLIVEVPFVMAAHWLVSREAIATVGGFSPAFKQYGEDDNWIHRLYFHKLRCGVVPAASAVHDRGGRKLPHEKKMQLKCISTVVKVSDPNRNWRWMCIREVLELVGMGLKNFSTIPWRYISEFNERLPELKELRDASMERGAFL